MKWVGLAFAIGLLCYEYAPVFNAPFVYEDARWIESGQGTSENLSELSPHRAPRLISRLLWKWQEGQSAWAFHAVNIGLHLMVALLVALLIGDLSSSMAAGWAASMVFLLHPMNMEAVGYLSGRAELIAAMGVLIACLSGLRRQWVGVVAGLAMGVLGKESAAIGMPLVALVCAMRAEWNARWLAISAALISVVVGTVFLVAPHDAVWTPAWTGLQVAAWVRHATQTVIPAESSVDFNYRAFPTWMLYGSVVFIAGVGGLAWRIRFAAPLVAIGLAWMICAALPRFVAVTTYSLLNEHQFYLSRIGIAFVAAHYWTLAEPCPA